tara:strand:- start:3 stop:386 length:384 start_codon:yes stop_codon:yes gene_type:complete
VPKIKKISKQNNKKASNVIPLKRDVEHSEAKELEISVEEQEKKRTNEFARKICDEIDAFVVETKLSADFAYYHFLFHLKQRTIYNVSYPLFQQANDASSNEVINNLAKYHKENCPELKTDAENHTIQ